MGVIPGSHRRLTTARSFALETRDLLRQLQRKHRNASPAVIGEPEGSGANASRPAGPPDVPKAALGVFHSPVFCKSSRECVYGEKAIPLVFTYYVSCKGLSPVACHNEIRMAHL